MEVELNRLNMIEWMGVCIMVCFGTFLDAPSVPAIRWVHISSICFRFHLGGGRGYLQMFGDNGECIYAV